MLLTSPDACEETAAELNALVERASARLGSRADPNRPKVICVLGSYLAVDGPCGGSGTSMVPPVIQFASDMYAARELPGCSRLPVCPCKSADIVFAIDVSYSMSGPLSSCGSTENLDTLVHDLTARVIQRAFGAQTVDKHGLHVAIMLFARDAVVALDFESGTMEALENLELGGRQPGPTQLASMLHAVRTRLLQEGTPGFRNFEVPVHLVMITDGTLFFFFKSLKNHLSSQFSLIPFFFFVLKSRKKT